MSGEVVSTEERQDAETLVEVTDLKTYYETGGIFGGSSVKAVDGVSFEIRRGETLGLVGESGCGKTTLGRTLIQLESITDGSVQYDGRDISTLSGSDRKRWRSNAQIVFQDPDSSLNDRMTVGEIVREPLDVYGRGSRRERRRRVRELLETVGLREEHYYRYPHQFSGGQRQRIGIARALALEPEFIVLDEPVSALDASVQAKILNLLEDLQEELGLTYLFIAHDLSVVRHLCDRVAVMYLGNIMELGPTEELFEDPANPYTHSLLSAIPNTDPTTGMEDRITLRGTPPSPRNPPEGCPFTTRCPAKIRPEAYERIDDELWERIEVFREILRERSRAQRSLSERAKEIVGMETRFSAIEEVETELFSDVDVPAEIREHLDRATELAADDENAAREHLRAEFGSECDLEAPTHHDVGSAGRVSLCHRHKPEYETPAEFFERHSVGER